MVASCSEPVAVGAESPADPVLAEFEAVMALRRAGNLYWSNGGLFCNVSAEANGSIARAPVAGGAAKALADGILAPRSIAVDSSSIVYLRLTDAGGDSGELKVVAK